MDSGSLIFSSFFDIFCHIFLPFLHKIFSFNLTNIILRLGISSLLYFRMPFLISTKVNDKLLRKIKFGSGLGSFPEIEEIPNSVHVRNYSQQVCSTSHLNRPVFKFSFRIQFPWALSLKPLRIINLRHDLKFLPSVSMVGREAGECFAPCIRMI